MTATIISFAEARAKIEQRATVARRPEAEPREKLSSIMLREICAQLGLPPLEEDTAH